MSKELHVEIGSVQTKKALRGQESYRSQSVSLVGHDHAEIVHGIVYQDQQFFTATWRALLYPPSILEHIETALVQNEMLHPRDYRTVKGARPNLARMSVEPTVVTVSIPSDDSFKRVDVPFNRPMTWEQMESTAETAHGDILCVRLNTPLGAFEVLSGKCSPGDRIFPLVTFSSDTAMPEAPSTFMSETTQGVIDMKYAQDYFQAMIALFK